jgi:cell wall-associated NlpC family hydrolase
VHGLSTARHRRASRPLSGKLALKVGLCLCAGQLVAGPILASAAEAAPLPVAAKSVRTPARVSETVNHTTVASKTAQVRVTAKVINPKTGKVMKSGSVRLQSLRNGHWRSVSTKGVTSKGYATFYVKGGGTFTTRFLGSGSVGPGTSNKIRVTIRSAAGKGAKVLAEAKKHTGALYLYAAAGPSRFDCSGFTMYVYKKAIGKKLPHKANSQQSYGKAVSKSKKQVGDLIVFRSGSYGYHAAIYAGGGYMYDSPHSGARVGKHKIYSSSYVVRRMA